MAQGGYQAPANPAPVAMPGALSRRTDGGPADRQPMRELPNPAYGEQQTFREDQQAGPMAASPGGAETVPAPADLSQVVPLDAGTEEPGQPVTAGANLGAGPTADVLGLGSDDDPSVQNLKNILPTLELMAASPSAGFMFRQFVQKVTASL